MSPLPTFKRRRAPEPERADESGLAHRYFLLQDERPEHVGEVEVEALDPFLRSLLFTDGTVTRTLGVQLLQPVEVTRLGQVEVTIPPAVAAYLETERGDVSVRRRVSIGVGPATALWAESFIVPERLPPGFLGLLDGAPDGIGQSLQRVALESYRELLWFGLDAAPEWAGPDATGATIRRLYRIVSNRQAAILISESFAVQQRAGVYHLADLQVPAAPGEGSR